MSNFKDWTIDDFPDPPWTKAQIEAWFSAASPGEQKAVNQCYTEYRAWRTNPSQAWFGVSIDPNRLKGKIVELANKYKCPIGPMSYKYDRGEM